LASEEGAIATCVSFGQRASRPLSLTWKAHPRLNIVFGVYFAVGPSLFNLIFSFLFSLSFLALARHSELVAHVEGFCIAGVHQGHDCFNTICIADNALAIALQ
jgi:hypothetical protein